MRAAIGIGAIKSLRVSDMIDREMEGLYMRVTTLRDKTKSAFFIITILVFILTALSPVTLHAKLVKFHDIA